MRVQVIGAGEAHVGVVPGFGVPGLDDGADAPSTYIGWRPRCVVGAAAPGGLLLPPAHPTAATMYAPRAAWTDGTRLICADTGNHRVLIWHELPIEDGASADVVLGQADMHSEGPRAGGRGPVGGLNLPTGVLVHDGRLLVADAWHHRVLIWDEVPTTSDTLPDVVLGQRDLESTEENAGGEADASSFYWPFGIAMIDGRFHVADTGNRRVLIWRDGIPGPGRPADVVLGQPDEHAREENRGGPVSADSFRWPHDFAATGAGGLMVADAGNHRVLRWDLHPEEDRPADAVLGHVDFIDGTEFPYVPQIGRMRFPYGIASVDGELAVADTANNRILLFDSALAEHHAEPAGVLAQPTLSANGENRWEQVASDTLCWPYGLHWWRGEDVEVLAVADSGNNRVMLWERSR